MGVEWIASQYMWDLPCTTHGNVEIPIFCATATTKKIIWIDTIEYLPNKCSEEEATGIQL
ncbi:hypothetical protein ACJX0J_011593, partial [Zea mays]